MIAEVLMVAGAFFIAVAALGVLRMPELYARMHSSTKAGTLGLGLILLSVTVHFESLGLGARAFATLAFVAMTAPVGAQMVGRAAYYMGVKLWQGTLVDELGQWRRDQGAGGTIAAARENLIATESTVKRARRVFPSR